MRILEKDIRKKRKSYNEKNRNNNNNKTRESLRRIKGTQVICWGKWKERFLFLREYIIFINQFEWLLHLICQSNK